MSSSGWAALRVRDFRLFVLGRLLAGAGLQFLVLALGWTIYERTKSAWALGMIGLASFLPTLVLALVAGQLADRIDRRLIICVCFGGQALAGAGLAACVLLLPDGVVWPIYALTMMIGAGRAFYGPATQALLPGLVPREIFPGAVGLNASVWQIASVTGPAIAGFLLIFGPSIAFAAAAVLSGLASLAFFAIRTRPQLPPREPVTAATVFAGIRFIRSRPVILGAISLDLFAVLLGGATALLPIYAQDILKVGPEGLGILRSMPALGAVSMAMILAQWPLRRRTGPTMLSCVGLFGLATVIFGLSTDFTLSLACLVILGAADMVSVYVRQSLVQGETPDDMRGRVAAVNFVFVGASNELGEFESGVLAALIGVVPAVVVGGVGTMIVAALWARLFPELRNRDRLLT